MIGFRYHIVSLTAVFLALAIGVIAGTTGISRPLLNELRNERDRITANNAVLRARSTGLERQAGMWDRYGNETFAANVAGALRGVSVVRIITGAPKKDLLDAIDASLIAAGATSGGTLMMDDRMALKDQRSREALGTAMAVPDRDSKDLWRITGERLASRMRERSNPQLETDLLRLLDDDGFLALEDVPKGAFPPANAIFLVISGGEPDVGGPVDPFLISLGTGLAGTRAIAVEPILARDSGIERLRAIVEVRDSVGTIDHVDTSLGRYAMVAALARENAGGASLHLGIGERASGLAPTTVRPRATPKPSVVPTPSRSS